MYGHRNGRHQILRSKRHARNTVERQLGTGQIHQRSADQPERAVGKVGFSPRIGSSRRQAGENQLSTRPRRVNDTANKG